MSVELAKDERIVWRGRPSPRMRFSAVDLYFIPMSFFWVAGTSGALVALSMGDAVGNVSPAAYVILPFFIVVGLYGLFGRIIVRSLVLKRTEYILTDSRAVILTGLFTSVCRSIDLGRVGEIRSIDGKNGSGSIEFGERSLLSLPVGWPNAGGGSPPAFEHIDDVRSVFELALRGQRSSRPPPTA